MKRFTPIISFLLLCMFVFKHASSQTLITGSRMNEVFLETDLVPTASGLSDPWEITYGPDGYLWITEAKGYKVYRMDPATGTKTTVLNISKNSTFLPVADRVFNCKFSSSQNPWPQGGCAGLAIHPDFMAAVNPKNYVYLSYVYSFDSTSVTTNGGVFFTNRVVRFTYNTGTGQLESPVSLCDTLPGSSDHNSQRMIIAPLNGVYYLFYAQGDMGAGQFGNAYRTNNAQNSDCYEGKILRFNLEPDGDADAYDQWIPNGNPYNGTNQSAVWCKGIRNNQGFAYANINGTNYLYGSSHGPFSDDEVNILDSNKNYGHPLVIGFKADGNYDNAKAAGSASALPLIGSEAANAAAMKNALGVANYRDPIYTFYPAPAGNSSTSGTIQYIYSQFNSGNQANGAWPSEAPSGMDIYTNSMIPGWKNSLMLGSLKGGKVIRLKLNSAGNGIVATPGSDTCNYFWSKNRFRDLAISPDGSTIFTIIDKSSTTSGPTTGSPVVSTCAGCVQKYTFLGYHSSGTSSMIPSSVDVAAGTANSCETANTININSANDTLWVPITDHESNIVAEIKANGNNLGNVTTSFYRNSGTIRETGYFKSLYLDRNITITPQTQPTTPVNIRLYLTTAEFLALKNGTNSLGQGSGISTLGQIAIFKNNDVCGTTFSGNSPVVITPAATGTQGANGYVLEASINSFSTFYFSKNTSPLPVRIISFTGTLVNQVPQLQWITEDNHGTVYYAIERSGDGRNYDSIGVTAASGENGKVIYNYADDKISEISSSNVYYRLKMVDADGKYSYSGIVSLLLQVNVTYINVRPNPVTDELNVEINAVSGDRISLELIDINGNIVLHESAEIRKGPNRYTMHIGKLAAGIYYLKATDANNTLGVKVQKL